MLNLFKALAWVVGEIGYLLLAVLVFVCGKAARKSEMDNVIIGQYVCKTGDCSDPYHSNKAW